MATSVLLRAPLVLAVFGSALSSQAVPISLTIEGRADMDANGSLRSISPITEQVGGLGTLETGLLFLSGGGSIQFLGPNDSLLLFLYGTSHGSMGGVEFFEGNWQVETATGSYGTSGAGAYRLELSNGVPTDPFSQQFDATMRFTGTVDPVPEPLSMVSLAFGAAALSRRRN